MAKVLLLNNNEVPLHVTSWKRALVLLIKGKAQCAEHIKNIEDYIEVDNQFIPRIIKMRYNVDIQNLFIEVYRAFPASLFGIDDINFPNSVILPPSALEKISKLKDFDKSDDQICFRILNIELNIQTYCTVLEFTAEEGTCFIPNEMFERLNLEEGQNVNLRNVKLKPGTFVLLKPHKTKLINNPNYKSIIKSNFNNEIINEGHTISVKIGSNIYKLDIIKCEPTNIIKINFDTEIQFETPKDYKKPIKFNNFFIKYSQNKIIKLIKKEIKNKMNDILNGDNYKNKKEEITNIETIKIIKAKKEILKKHIKLYES